MVVLDFIPAVITLLMVLKYHAWEQIDWEHCALESGVVDFVDA